MSVMRPAMREAMREAIAGASAPGRFTLVNQALSILRRPGITANVYLPGIGTLSGLAAANYLDSVGTTLATVDSPVGLVLDAMGSVGVELTPSDAFTNLGRWSFSNCTGSFAGGNLVVTATSTAVITASISGTYTNPATFQETHTVSQLAASVIRYIRGSNVFSSGSSSLATDSRIITSSNGSELVVFQMSATIGQTFTVNSDLSVKQVTGIHATQPTTAAKPRLERGVRNLLLQSVLPAGTAGTVGSGAVSPTSWVFINTGGTVSYLASAYGGGAVRFVASGTRPAIGQGAASVVAGSVVTQSFIVDAVNSGALTIYEVATMGGVTAGMTAKVNGVSVPTNTALVTGDRVSVTFTVSASTSPQVRLGPGASGAATGDITLSNIMLEVGSIASDYSPTTTAAASNPSAGKYSWAFDGGDSLSLGSVPFQMSDDHAVILSCSMDNPGAEYGAALGFVSGTTAVLATLVNAAGSLQFRYKNDAATTFSMILDAAYTPSTRLVASVRNISGTVVARKNGVQAGSASPTGVFTLTGAFIGVNPLGGSSLKGSTGPILAIKGTLTDSEMLTLERVVASLTPNAPSF